jgi:flagellar basal-body rod protein FlgB
MCFDKTMNLLSAGIYYSGLRHKVIANNIANINTPNYKAMDITFKEQLALCAKSSSAEGVTIGSLPPPTSIYSTYLSDQRPSIDLNTVDIDQEQVKLAQNTLFHNSCLQLLTSKLRIIKAGITGNT